MSTTANFSTTLASASRPHVESATPASPPPPSSSVFLAENNILQDSSFLTAPSAGRSVSPGAASLQAARSPGQSLVSSPQNPPALPVLPKYRGGWDSLSSSPEHRRTDSSAYYTTAWGSPYATPSPPRPARSLGRLRGIDIDSRDSSPYPIPEPVSATKIADSGKPASGPTGLFSKQLYSSVGRSAGKDLLGKQGKSVKDFTQDWINSHLTGERRSERTNWLSDDSGSETGSFWTAYNHLGDDQSEGWLALEDDTQTQDEDLLKTPTSLASFVKRKAKSRVGGAEKPKLRAKHLPAKSTDTLKQSDFWGFAYDKDASSPNMSETGSVAPAEQPTTTAASGSEKPISPVDKPLPPPPASEQADAEQPASNSTATPTPSITPTITQKPALSQTQSFQRPRKRLVWRGKACVIALPLEDRRGSPEFGGPLLTAADVEARLKEWESEGFDTRGFEVHSHDEDLLGGGQSRPSFPEQIESEPDLKEHKCVVSFPNQSEWEDYVQYLKEEKLRALGVSLGESDAQNTASPAASVSMSHASSLPVLPLSPPVPTSSVATNHLHMANNSFSPHFNQSTNNSNLVSLASPSPHIGGTPQPTISPFFGADQTSAYPFPQFQPTPPSQGTFQAQNFFNLRQNEFPQVGSSGLSNLNNVLSPVSPLPFEGGDQFATNTGDFADMVQPTRAQTPPNRQDQPVNDEEPLQSSSNLEIAHPTPRGHRHNVSETLQKGVEKAESRLEDAIQQQLEEDKQKSTQKKSIGNDLMKSKWAIPEDDAAPANQSQGPTPTDSNPLLEVRTFGGHRDFDENKDEIDTNPSLSGTPANDHNRNVSWQRSRGNTNSFVPGHQSKPSGSALNVEAKAFDPTQSFASNSFAFGGGNNFQPSPAFQGPSAIFNPETTEFQPVGDPSGGYNASTPTYPPKNIQDSASTGSSFKFSSASFNVAAPVFNPGRSLNSNSGTSSLAGSIDHTNAPNKIFGDINIPQISKPSRRSKAIPIVRPDEVSKKDSATDGPEHAEDESGRVDLAQNRQKRARRGGSDGDREPEFAVPTHPLTETGKSPSPAVSETAVEGKDNAEPEEKDTVEDAPDSQPSSATPKEDVSADAPHEEVSELNASEPERTLDVSELETSRIEDQETTTPSKDLEQHNVAIESEKVPSITKSPAEEAQTERKPRTGLSAFAKPFEFKPSIPSLLKPNTPTFPKKKSVGLEGSRYAVISPPSSPKADDSPTLPMATEESEISSHHQEEKSQDKSQNFRDTGSTAQASPDEPTFQEIDAVMQQLNEDNSEVGIERVTTPANRPIPPEPEPESDDVATDNRLDASTRNRSHAPSPSPRRMHVPTGNMPKLTSDLKLRSPVLISPDPSRTLDVPSPVHQLHSNNEHLSDWDDAISSGEDEKLHNRTVFFDTHVNELVGGILEERLNPLERTLSAIQQSVSLLSSRSQSRGPGRKTPPSIEHSDADDEDEEESANNRSRSPMAKIDRRNDKIKNAVAEALAAHKPAAPEPAPPVDLTQIHNSLAELKLLSAERPQHEQPGNVKNVIEEAILNHPKLNDLQTRIDQDMGAENMKLQVDGLKSMLRIADERAEEEHKARREAQDALEEARRLQKIAEDDAARFRESAEEAERKFRELNEEKLPEFERIEKRSNNLEEEQKALQMTLSEISDKNIALQGTLDEYRVSSDQWRSEIEETRNENNGLRGTIGNLKVLVSETMQARQKLREKFNAVQEDMVSATQNIARDQAAWRKKEEELNSNYGALRAAYDREVKLREKLELDISDLEQQEKEAAKLKIIFAHAEQDKERLEETVATLRKESQEYQDKAARFEREFNEARESSRMEIQRTKTAMEADVEAANNQVNHVRAEYETEVARLQSKLENLEMDADTAKERHELQLEEAKDAKAAAVQEAIDAKDNALQEQRQSHERSLNDLRERHARVLHNASEDKQRSETHLAERLSLKDDQIEHLKDKVTHLEEKLEITKSAARAAAEAAQGQSNKGSTEHRPSHSASPSMSFAQGSTIPEKISPQALRESILVLQDQLQQREGRIEELESELSKTDPDAPVKIKEKDTEINWLRELLGVRVDDLQDIIDRLSQPSFNQYAVRDAAIRLKANLQMQQQEKERAMSGGQNFPSISTISNLAASPRSLPLAAAAAWGNWRKGRENSVTSNVSESTVGGSNNQTPSKSTVNPQSGFLSGLLTPPSSHVRQTPTNSSAPPAVRPMGGRESFSESRPLRRQSNSGGSYRGLSARQMEKRPQYQEPPQTPPLLRNSSYDRDAEANDFEDGAYAVDDGEGSMIGGYVTEESAEAMSGPFGPQIPS